MIQADRSESPSDAPLELGFLRGAATDKQFPPDTEPEVAFAGRSNAGKSSALNALANRRGLARTSRSPGRTREINFFEVRGGGRVADLPGYGYAAVSKETRRRWSRTVDHYLKTRGGLRGLVLVMDVRHPLTDNDLVLLQWCRARGLPVYALLTKADKLSKSKATQTRLNVERSLAQGPYGCRVELFSAPSRSGVTPLLRWIRGLLQESRER